MTFAVAVQWSLYGALLRDAFVLPQLGRRPDLLGAGRALLRLPGTQAAAAAAAATGAAPPPQAQGGARRSLGDDRGGGGGRSRDGLLASGVLTSIPSGPDTFLTSL